MDEPKKSKRLIIWNGGSSFEPFIMNFHMNGLNKMLTELQGMLNTADVSLRKAPGHVMTVRKGKKQKRLARLRNLLKVRLLGRKLRPKKRIKG